MAAAADSCLFPNSHPNHNRSLRPSFTISDKPQWLLLSYRRMTSLTQGDALGNESDEAAAALTVTLRELLRRLGRMETPGCHSGKCNNPFERPAWRAGAVRCRGQRLFQIHGQPLRRGAHGGAQYRGADRQRLVRQSERYAQRCR